MSGKKKTSYSKAGKQKSITMRISEKLERQLNEEAEEMGEAISVVVRLALKEFFERKEVRQRADAMRRGIGAIPDLPDSMKSRLNEGPGKAAP